jgi:hypothetical protein
MQTQWIKTADSLLKTQDIRVVSIETVGKDSPKPYFLLQTNQGALYRATDETLINSLRDQLERFLIAGESKLFDLVAQAEEFERARNCS